MNEEAPPGQEAPLRQGAPPRQETPTRQETPLRQEAPPGQESPPRQETAIDELTAIRKDLAEWEQYCSDWARAYHRAAQSTLRWNTWLVMAGIGLAAITTGFSGAGGVAQVAGSTLPFLVPLLAFIGALAGVATTAVTGLQKLPFASPEQAKQYHSAAVAYESAKRDIESALTSVVVEDLKKQRDTVKSQLNATDAQAPELPQKHSP